VHAGRLRHGAGELARQLERCVAAFAACSRTSSRLQRLGGFRHRLLALLHRAAQLRVSSAIVSTDSQQYTPPPPSGGRASSARPPSRRQPPADRLVDLFRRAGLLAERDEALLGGIHPLADCWLRSSCALTEPSSQAAVQVVHELARASADVDSWIRCACFMTAQAGRAGEFRELLLETRDVLHHIASQLRVSLDLADASSSWASFICRARR
jgi:hypothetical protein